MKYYCDKCHTGLVPPCYAGKLPQRAKYCDKCKAIIDYDKRKQHRIAVKADMKRLGINQAEYYSRKRAKKKGTEYKAPVIATGSCKTAFRFMESYKNHLKVLFWLMDEYKRVKGHSWVNEEYQHLRL